MQHKHGQLHETYKYEESADLLMCEKGLPHGSHQEAPPPTKLFTFSNYVMQRTTSFVVTKTIISL